MAAFLQHRRNNFVDKHDRVEDVRAGENFPHPVRKIHYTLNDGTSGHATVIAESDDEAIELFSELAEEDELVDLSYEIDSIFPNDEQIDAIEEHSDRLYSHLHRKRKRRNVGEIKELLEELEDEGELDGEAVPA